MHWRTFAATLAFVGLGLALPTGDHSLPETRTLGKRTDIEKAIALIEAIMPSSTSCSDRGDECTTATDAAAYLTASMAEYEITNGIPQAGIIALIAYESVEMQYKKNTAQANAGNLGRGTANMQSGDFNVEFAADLGLGSSYTTATVLDLATTNNKFNFYSGAWFYHKGCTETHTLENDADAWFASYLGSECVGLGDGWNTSQPERWAYWVSAKTAFNFS